MIESITSGNVIHQHRPSRSTVVASGNGTKSLLTCGVSDLQFYFFIVNGDD